VPITVSLASALSAAVSYTKPEAGAFSSRFSFVSLVGWITSSFDAC